MSTYNTYVLQQITICKKHIFHTQLWDTASVLLCYCHAVCFPSTAKAIWKYIYLALCSDRPLYHREDHTAVGPLPLATSHFCAKSTDVMLEISPFQNLLTVTQK